jgi:hypothetical protein
MMELLADRMTNSFKFTHVAIIECNLQRAMAPLYFLLNKEASALLVSNAHL